MGRIKFHLGQALWWFDNLYYIILVVHAVQSISLLSVMFAVHFKLQDLKF